MDIIRLIAETGGTLGLAIFSIWLLHKQSERLVDALERNTEAWRETTKALTEVTLGIAVIADATNVNRDTLSDLRTILARRPCTADAVTDGTAKRGP